MNTTADHEAIARAIADANLYMVLGTADEAGHPWVSPVYFAPVGDTEFLWVSRTYRRHSRNLAVRPEVSLVIYDSQAPVNTGRGVYATGVAGEVPPEALPELVAVYTRRVIGHGGAPLAVPDVVEPAPHRLYRATATEVWALDENDDRIPVFQDDR